MICVSLSEPTPEACLAALKGLAFAEIRMDRMDLSIDDARRLFESHTRLIATYRPDGVSDEKRGKLLLAAVDAGAAYVDVEVDTTSAFRSEIVAAARKRGCEVIVSFHDHEKTPDRKELDRVIEACFSAGADIAKIACQAHSDRDNARLLGLLDDPRRIVVVGMGAKGRITRLLGPLLGSPFSFASLSEGRETAEGQMDGTKLLGLMEAVRKETALYEGGRP